MEKIDIRIRQCKELLWLEKVVYFYCVTIFLFFVISRSEIYMVFRSVLFSLSIFQLVRLRSNLRRLDHFTVLLVFCIVFLYSFVFSTVSVCLVINVCLFQLIFQQDNTNCFVYFVCDRFWYILHFNIQYACTHVLWIGVKCVYISLTFHSDSCLPDRCLKVIKLY